MSLEFCAFVGKKELRFETSVHLRLALHVHLVILVCLYGNAANVGSQSDFSLDSIGVQVANHYEQDGDCNLFTQDSLNCKIDYHVETPASFHAPNSVNNSSSVPHATCPTRNSEPHDS